jgi:hypothetical protein
MVAIERYPSSQDPALVQKIFYHFNQSVDLVSKYDFIKHLITSPSNHTPNINIISTINITTPKISFTRPVAKKSSPYSFPVHA